VELTWQAPKPKPGITVVGYSVYRRTVDGGEFVKIADRVPTTSYRDELIGAGRTYVYAVTAVDQTGRESRFSEVATANIP